MSPAAAIEKLHAGISRRDLWRLVWQTGGTIERVYRTGEYRIRYAHRPVPSAAFNARRKDVPRDSVLYVKNALLTAPAPEQNRREEPEPNDLKSDLSEGLKRLREARGLSQRELGDLTGLTREQIGGWERDEADPTDEEIAKLAKVLPAIMQYIDLGEEAPEEAPPAEEQEEQEEEEEEEPDEPVPPKTDTFAAALRRERIAAGLTRNELNIMLDGSLSSKSIKNWEMGICNPNTVETYERLIALLPGLKNAPVPHVRYHKKPPAPAPAAPAAPPAPAPVPAPPAAPAPPPSAAALGSQYGIALADLAAAKRSTAAARAAEKEAQKKADAAHEALMAATV